MWDLVDREPPNDAVAERATLGALLLSARLTVDLSTSDFYYPAHQQIFDVLKDMDDPDLVTVGQRVPNLRHELMECANAVAIPSKVDEYATIVRDMARRRAVITATYNAGIYAYTAESADEAEVKALTLVREAQRPAGGASVGLADLVNQEITDLLKPQHFVTVPGFSGIALAPQSFVVIGARPKNGKSAFGVQLALDWSREYKTAFFSYEMSASQIVRRIISRFSGLSVSDLNRGIQDGDRNIIEALMGGSLEGRDFTLKSAAGMKPAELFASLRRFASAGGRIAVIDYLQLAAASRKDLRTETTVFTNELKQVALQTGLVIIALSQLRRPEDERALKPPMPSELRESGSIEQDADVVFLMHMLPSLRDPQQGDKAREFAITRTPQFFDLTSLQQEGEPWWTDKRLMILEASLVRQGEMGRKAFVFDGSTMNFSVVQ